MKLFNKSIVLAVLVFGALSARAENGIFAVVNYMLRVVVAAASFAAYAWVFSKVYAFMTTPMSASFGLSDVFLP